MTQLLQETQLDPHQHELVETVSSSAQGPLAIINDILDFSKIEAGKLSLAPFELRQLVTDDVALVGTECHNPRLSIAHQRQ